MNYKYFTKSFLVLPIIFFIIFPYVSYAHEIGESAFKINGSNTQSLSNDGGPYKDVPIDIAPQVYEANQKINFEVETSMFHHGPSIYEKTALIWDFGDGSPKETFIFGITNSHIYKVAGTYRLTITADYNTATGQTSGIPMLLQIVVINIKQPTILPISTSSISSGTKTSKSTSTSGILQDSKEVGFNSIYKYVLFSLIAFVLVIHLYPKKKLRAKR